jgi:uncharacterized protein with von Willebrand factor type A (vWA) domain
MSPDELPLLDLFNRLRQHGLPLGAGEYMAVLRALRAGFGVGDRRALEQLCCMLWVKSDEEARLFRRLFDQMLVQPIDHPQELSPREAPQSPSEMPAEQPMEEPAPETPPLAPRPTALSKPSALVLEMDEPAQVVQAIRRGARDDLEMRRPRFILVTEYFPVTRRQMKQSWRYLRRPVREGPPEELDVVATVEKIGREAILLEPVLVPRRSNRAELVLLIDQDGSMVPFHFLSRQLIETARRGGRLRQAGVYYFHDYPDNYLYRDPARLKAQPIPEALATIGKRAVVLIVSDAGAARCNFDEDRVDRTRVFVQLLKGSIRRYAWLNPMPNTRWPNTSAGEIARFVPMFEMSRRGLDAAISALRGRYVYWERMYPWMM